MWGAKYRWSKDEKLSETIQNILGLKNSLRDQKVIVRVEKNEPGEHNVFIEASSMYDRPEITFEKLCELSELFQTKKIDLKNGLDIEGCETCNYGSSYSVEIIIRKATLPE